MMFHFNVLVRCDLKTIMDSRNLTTQWSCLELKHRSHGRAGGVVSYNRKITIIIDYYNYY